VPLFLGGGQSLVLLTMSRDHKLYYEAYNDASDINGDGVLDVGFKPDINYYGYFDSYKCYDWGGTSGRFVPSSVSADKKCTSKWSGNFLNYVTMTRMDAMRKVLYGGYRSTDGDSITVLERSYIPQDAHSWGKEYESEARDGYKITDYTPLAQPSVGTRHLFANTTLLNPPTGSEGPLMRVLTNSQYRIWEWVSIERPVAGTKCLHGSNGPDCTATATGSFVTVPASTSHGLSGLTQSTYKTTGNSPGDAAGFATLQSWYETAADRCGSQAASTVNGSGNPFSGTNGCTNDNYMTIFSGTLNVAAGGTYEFSIDGDDAIDLTIDGNVVVGWYGGHGQCSCDTNTASVYLSAGTHTIRFRHHEQTGGDNYYLRWRSNATTAMTDYKVRVEVCNASVGLESDCKGYPIGVATPTVYRPTGLLHEFGEDHTMAFGLLSGSYTNNLQGGVLRRNVGNFGNEIDSTTGKFNSAVDGIVKTLNAFAITGFGGNYEYSCGWKTDGPLNNGNCSMWGNPVAEMMYEGLRYLAGKSNPTTEFGYSGATDGGIALPNPGWLNPYRSTSGGYAWCSKPFQMVISDINPSYDSDQVPGSAFSSFSGDLTGLNASSLGQTIWNGESEPTNVFIGQSGGTYDGAPTAKTVSSFGDIRGLAPEEPTKQGSYYAASVAYYGNINKITSPDGVPTSELAAKQQNVQTFAVALASPLPRIAIPTAAGKTITLVPFAKSVGGSSISATNGAFQPTNQIVDFYVDTIRNVSGFPTDAGVNAGRPYYKFRINYEDVEQGADHDMDAIVEYTVSLDSDDKVQVQLDSTYAAGGIIQHMGYVVSGSTTDGTYLVVRDQDTSAGSDPDYFLDTPNTAGVALPLTSSRTFAAGTGASASFLKHDPLWYAAKWGGFTDIGQEVSGVKVFDKMPSVATEWDRKSTNGALTADGTPDNYYLVTNASTLKDQLRAAFSEISERVSSASAVAQNSTRLDTDSLIFQARFNTQDWTGQLRAFEVTPTGNVDVSSPVWDAAQKMPTHSGRNLYTWDKDAFNGSIFNVGSGGLTTAQIATLGLSSLSSSDQAKYVAYLRGDSSNEQKSGGVFRNRSSSLGDIVNSDPVFVAAEDFGYERLPEAADSSPNSYAQFRDVVKAARRKMLYVSSNDGVVHGFDATEGATGGVEQFGFVPAATHSQLKKLVLPGYSHQYFVDGPLYAGDAYFGSPATWRTVLLGTTGAAPNKSVFALDITAPDAFSASKVMWEFTHTDLGYPMGQPVIARMPNGRWAAVFGNGYESAAGRAKLFIVYLDANLGDDQWTAGTDYCVLAPDDTISGNGLSTPSLLDKNGDGIVDAIYAGDLQGNVWKFAIDGSGVTASDNCPTAKWKKEKLVFQTPLVTCRTKSVTGVVSTCSSPTTKRQPITAPIEISAAQSGQDDGVMLFFGTGMYFQSSDVNDMTQQAFYGIWDDASTSTVTETQLVQQTIDTEGKISLVDQTTKQNVTYDYRVTSENPVDYASKKGWYMNLLKPNPDAATPQYNGERVVTIPLLRGGRVIFTTLIPSTDPCAFGGESWVMEVNLASGSSPASPVFDLNGDSNFDSGDKAGGSVVSGIKSSEGLIKTPAVVSAGSKEYKLSSDSAGKIFRITERGALSIRRTSWRQIQ
jgi:type IV pilus assembly protein PilY1